MEGTDGAAKKSSGVDKVGGDGLAEEVKRSSYCGESLRKGRDPWE